MTYKELKDFCEKNNVRYEINPILSKPSILREHRTVLGFEIGMNNIAGRKGKSEWQWVWFETLLVPSVLEDDTRFIFRERYSQLNGKSYKGWKEDLQAFRTIKRRMK